MPTPVCVMLAYLHFAQCTESLIPMVLLCTLTNNAVCSARQSVSATSVSVLLDATSCHQQSKKKSKTMPIILGAVLGGVAFITVIIIVLLYVFRRTIPFFPHARPRTRTEQMILHRS